MTQEQIATFEVFLKNNDMYKAFYNALSGAPIETAYMSKSTYMPRISPLLVLSFGFFQDRNIDGVKEKEWRLLRESWIRYAAGANILGERFKGIEPENIISAINGHFNGKQFSGMLKDSDSNSLAIALKADSIQSIRDQQRIANAEKDIQNYRDILNLPVLVSPDVMYPVNPVKSKVDNFISQIKSNSDFAAKRKLVIKAISEIRINVEGYKFETVADDIERMIVLFGQMIDARNSKYNELLDAYNERREAYIKSYNERQLQIADAKEKIEEYEARLKKEEDEKVLEEIADNEESEEQTNAADNSQEADADDDEEKIIIFGNRSVKPKAKISKDRISVTYNAHKSAYYMTINSENSKDIKGIKGSKFDILSKGGKLYIKIHKDGAESLTQSSCTYKIVSKDIVRGILDYYNISSIHSYAYIEMTEKTDSMIKYRINSIVATNDI